MVKRKSRLVKFGDRKIPLIEKELNEISSDEVTAAVAKHGAVYIRDPRFAAEKKRLEKQGKKAMKKLGWLR